MINWKGGVHLLANFKDRLSALETKIANEGILLNDAQIAALEKKKQNDIASGETETMHPGYSFSAGHILWSYSQMWCMEIQRPPVFDLLLA